MNPAIIEHRLTPLREQLIQHPLYRKLDSLESLRHFTESHIFAVWDFMSLLKALQRDLTCVDVPWVPVGKPSTRYLINEIVAGEESDIDQHGVRMSHFELYLRAMQELKADTSAIVSLLSDLQSGKTVREILTQSKLPAGVADFVGFTFEIIERNRLHELAAVFTFGREDLIPDMFVELVSGLNDRFPGQVETYQYYLERHIEVDGGHHGHLALEMVRELCGEDPVKWEEAAAAAEEALRHRIGLWTAIASGLPVS